MSKRRAELPFIRLPQDPEWQILLAEKRDQYRKRITNPKEHADPDTLFAKYEFWAVVILTRLLEEKTVQPISLSHTFFKEFGASFTVKSYDQAVWKVFWYTKDLEKLRTSLRRKH